MKQSKKGISLILVLALLLCLAACTGRSNPTGTENPGGNTNSGAVEGSDPASPTSGGNTGGENIVFWDMYWGNTQYESLVRSLVEQYNAEHDGPDVVVEMRPWATYYQDYLTAVMSGNAPDVACGQGDNSVLYGRMGELVDLSSIVEEWKANGFYDTFPKGSIELHNIDGKQYGIPWIMDLRLFFYNIEMFDEAGIEIPARGYFTFAELYDACEKLANAGFVPMAMPGLDFMNQQAINYLLVAGDGDYGCDENYQAAVNSPRNLEIYHWIDDMVDHQYIAPESVGFTADQQIAMFASDECAIIISNMERIIDPELYGTKYGILTAPVWNENDPSRNIAYINPMVVFSQTEYPEECKQFVKWWVENNGILFSEGEANFSPSREINNTTEMMENARNKMILENVFDNVSYYVYPAEHLYSAAVTIGGENHLGHLFTELLMNQTPVEDLAEKYQAILEQIVAENPEP